MELAQLGGYFAEGGFIGEALAGSVDDDAVRIGDFPGAGSAHERLAVDGLTLDVITEEN